jgi:hypothetical protein
VGPEDYWNESDYSWNVTIEENVINDCRAGVNLVSDGAQGNRNIIIRNNTVGTIINYYTQTGSLGNAYAISLVGCDGVTISGNNFGVPNAGETMRFNNCNNITLANNLVAWSPSGKSILKVQSGVTSLQGGTNGVLYSGRPYALTNSLSGLLLANPFGNSAGNPVQQYKPCNASGRWILQPDGEGHAKVISAANGHALGINGSLADGSPLVLEPLDGSDGQRWTLAPVGTSTVQLVNRLSGLSATVETTEATEVVDQATGTSGSGRLWTPAFNDYTYAAWASANGMSSDPMVDDDRNGIVNLLEYALSSATTGSAVAGEVMPLWIEAQTNDYLTLTSRRRVAATDIVFNVECSTDLSDWHANAVLVSSTPNPDGTTTEVWRSPSFAGDASGFIRVHVETTD